ncbi:hypothetical protein LCGC14_2273450 [marine sediment metagenome]|uniref:Uncharacterized protein n=1 Tax=marine sediment metagenome TaxID=412755 RepID=A0A0F9DIJ1_9ZZZZ
MYRHSLKPIRWDGVPKWKCGGILVDTVKRAQAIYLARCGYKTREIAETIGTAITTIRHWTKHLRKHSNGPVINFWTPEKTRQALALKAIGHTGREIAKIIGAPSRNSVLGQLWRLKQGEPTDKPLAPPTIPTPSPMPPSKPKPSPTIYTGNACTTPSCTNQRMKPWGYCSIHQRAHMPTRTRDHMAEVVE